MNFRYVVTDKGPIDRIQPGAVAEYDAEKAERLRAEGYLRLQVDDGDGWQDWIEPQPEIEEDDDAA